MPDTVRTCAPTRPEVDVLRIDPSDDPDDIARLLEPLWARLHDLLGAQDAPADSPAVAELPDASERRRAAESIEGLVRSGERVLEDIQSLEAAKARLEADLLSAYGALHSIEEQQIAALPANAPSRLRGRVSSERVVGEEIALATGVGVGEVARRLSLATSPGRHRTILGALRAGTTSLHRALQVASETAVLSDADVRAVEEAVLAPSRDGLAVSQRTFVTRLRRAVASVDGRGADERRAHARSRRGVFGRLTGDGMGCLTMVTDADAIAAVMDRLDTQAQAARGAGDVRTLDQLRCDLATEALLQRGEAERVDAVVPVTGRPAALVWVVVPFEVATGASNAACELPGHGWVTAAHAREVMSRAGSVWRTLPVDVRDGRAIARPSRHYRPSPAMVEHVQAVDGVCRGPGCEVLASRCDVDHETPWPTGPTAVDNLFSKHRLHHNLKTEGIWKSRSVDDDELEWTTLAGRTYVTRPKDWREALTPPEPDTRDPHPPPPWRPEDPPPF